MCRDEGSAIGEWIVIEENIQMSMCMIFLPNWYLVMSGVGLAQRREWNGFKRYAAHISR